MNEIAARFIISRTTAIGNVTRRRLAHRSGERSSATELQIAATLHADGHFPRRRRRTPRRPGRDRPKPAPKEPVYKSEPAERGADEPIFIRAISQPLSESHDVV